MSAFWHHDDLDLDLRLPGGPKIPFIVWVLLLAVCLVRYLTS